MTFEIPTDHRDLRKFYGGADRRDRVRPAEEGLSAILFGRILAEHYAAEVRYFRALDTLADKRLEDVLDALEYRELDDETKVIAMNAHAEGLAKAISVLSGVDVVEIRAKAAAAYEARRELGRSGLERARAHIGGVK